MANTTSV